MPLLESRHEPLSTYRVQLHGKFTFAALGSLLPYFRDLGISDLYLSPIFAAVPGSRHGYDVTDYSEVNPELGGLDGFRQLAASLRGMGGGIILDFVPNHMGIAGMLNQWWRDVLEYGQQSRYAPFFDIQWNADFSQVHPRVLVPMLLDHYGVLLEKGELKLIYDDGFSLRYGDTTLPIRPDSYGDIIGSVPASTPELDLEEMRRLAAGFVESGQSSHTSEGRTQTALAEKYAALKGQLQSMLPGNLPVREWLASRLAALNGTPGDPRSFDPLHQLIEKQHYRLARWQAGTHEINYRRFFAIDTLVGLHMENPEVFRECHALVNRLLASGDVGGLRIDHIDGLRQPEDYLRRIQLVNRTDNSQPVYLLVEKILAQKEELPDLWPVHGTTGYEFISQIGGIHVDRTQEGVFEAAYRRFTGETTGYPELVHRTKRIIIAEMFANAVSNLGAELVQLVAEDRRWRDLTRHELTTAVSEFMVHLPVYRTFRRRLEEVSASDRGVLERACAEAIADTPRADPHPLTFLRDLLIGRYPAADAPPRYRERVLGWVLTFQQYTGAIMAKSVEDTAFYNYNRFVALNEVGCDPGTFGGTVAEFHRANETRLAHSPLSLLATSTHDSKFSEDVRARLNALSELGAEWEEWVNDWHALTVRHTVAVAGRPAPDVLDQYRFFQVLLGAWPLRNEDVTEHFRERLKGYFRKAVDEAKRHTSILNRNDAYLAACDSFVDNITSPETAPGFLASFRPKAERVARLGMINSLTQLVLKCTVPGVPDFYQGNEAWHFSLVDPDNRRPVNYSRRQRLLGEAATAPFFHLLENWRDGAIKVRLTRELLRLRQSTPSLFLRGSYRSREIAGAFLNHVIAFHREHEGESLLVVVPRLTACLGCPPLGLVWDDTRLVSEGEAGEWRDALTGRTFPRGEDTPLRTLFMELPLAVLCHRMDTPK